MVIRVNNPSEYKQVVQNSERDIYNVLGNLTVNQYYLDDKNDIFLKVKDIEVTKPINYFNQLREKFMGKNILIRKNYIDDINKILEDESEVLLFGEPGVGKTTIITQISEGKDSIYISLKRFSTLKSILYLINSIRFNKNLDLIHCENIEDALSYLEQELVNSNIIFIVDDCEKNIDMANSIQSIEKFDNKFIFVSRSDNLCFKSSIQQVKVSPFDENEIKKFLQINNLELSIAHFNEIINSSNGNPLYLEYFTKFQIFPIPNGLEAFLRTLWGNLDDFQKSILSVTSLTLNPISQQDLLLAINRLHQSNLNPIDLNKIVKSISELIYIQGGRLEIAHPFFSEFIRRNATNEGLSDWYKKEMGEVFLKGQNLIEAVHLLLNIQDDKIFDELLYVFPYYIEMGLWDLAINVLLKYISLNKNTVCLETGYAYYHLSNCYRLIGNEYKGKKSLEKALNIFGNIDERNWISVCQIWRALDLVEEGNIDVAKKVCSEIFERNLDDKKIEATILVNLSKFYIDIFDFEMGSTAAKQSFHLFEELNDKKGIIASLVNLSICLMKLDEIERALEYCNTLYKLSEQDEDEFLKATVLNNMTICYRKLGNTELAEKVCLECISIWSKFGQKNKMSMNLLNLGNIFRDTKEYEKSKKYYLEGLEIANEIGLAKEQGRAYELLANIFRNEDDLNLAIEYADKAIEFSSKAKDNYRVAEAWVEKALAQKDLSDFKGAIDSYKQSIVFFKISQQDNEILNSIIEVIELYRETKMSEELNDILNEILEFVDKNIISVRLDNINYFINLIKAFYSKEKNGYVYLKLFENALENKYYISTDFVLTFLDFCKTTYRLDSQIIEKNVDMFIGKISDTRYANLLVLLLEQSGNLIDNKAILNILDRISKQITGIYYRIVEPEEMIITFSWNNHIMFQVKVSTSNIQVLKMGIVISLIIKINEDLFNLSIDKFYEENLTFYIFEDTVLKEIDLGMFGKIDSDQFPIVFLQRTDFDIFQPVVVRHDYYHETNYNNKPKNKVLVWVLMMVFNIVNSHFTHNAIDSINHTDIRRTLIHRMLDVFEIKDGIKIINMDESGTLSSEDLLRLVEKLNFKQI